MRGALIGMVLLTALAEAGCDTAEEDAPRRGRQHTVRIEGMVFQPKTIAIAAGDSVVWINKDLVPHAAASSGAGFDSKVLQFNESFARTFVSAGEFEYVCPFHPAMKGTLQVR
jgi:plastocyanin